MTVESPVAIIFTCIRPSCLLNMAPQHSPLWVLWNYQKLFFSGAQSYAIGFLSWFSQTFAA